MTHPHQPARGTQRGKATRSKAKALRTLQQQQQAHTQPDDLLQQVEAHLKQQQHATKTAELIDALIRRYPDCPKFASLLVDRLVAGDEALEDALRSEGIS